MIENSNWTLDKEPISHSTKFWQEGEELDKIVFNFDALGSNADGYLILRSNTSFGDNDYPSNSSTYNVNDTFGNSTLVAKITDNTATSYTFNNISKEKSWQFALVPYNVWANEATAHYKTDKAPTVKGYTIPTLGEWAIIVFAGLMLGFGILSLRKFI